MARAPRLVVVGSANVDLSVATRALPRPGETVLGSDLTRSVGGKGANQAVAAARLGAATTFVGCVGRDDAGEEILAALADAHVTVEFVGRSGRPTGTALVVTDSAGDNLIVVSSGANQDVSLAHVSLDTFDGVLTQLETPLDVLEACVARHERVVLNAAPAVTCDADILRRCDVVIANEREAATLPVDLLARCVVTRGARGAQLWAHGRCVLDQPAPAVDPVDSVGAGDAFAAAFTVRHLAGDDDRDALRYAVCAGSLATLGRGAQGALPTDVEVRAWLQREW